MTQIYEQLEEFKTQEAQIKGWQPGRRPGRDRAAKATAGPRPRPGPTSMQSGGPPADREDQTEDPTETAEQEEWETLDESPRSKALSAMMELLQDENANETTSQLVENLRSHLGADTSEM